MTVSMAGAPPGRIKVLHAYKVFVPDMFGGIPHVIETITASAAMSSAVVAPRSFGWGGRDQRGTTRVQRVASLGTLSSVPLAPTYPFAMARLAWDADVVAHHAPFPLTDLALLGLPEHVALVIHWHADIVGREWLKRGVAPLIRRSLTRADRIVVTDDTMLESKALACFRDKCTTVPLGCDVRYWGTLDGPMAQRVAELRRRKPRLVVAVGRLVGYKGFDVLLHAAKHVDTDVVVIGDGVLRQPLSRLAQQLGIAERIEFRGGADRDDVKAHMHAAAVVVVPSVTDAEAFGLVQIEAMAAGRPVINTALRTAVPRVVRHGLEGLTVLPGDAPALAKAIARLLADPDFAARLAAGGRQRAFAEFDQSVFQSRIEAVYADALARRRRRVAMAAP
ncbi:glycosyltransferase [Bradyrhizobium sp. HKCCYLR20261]|uniref:glycosyltransferase n=1 Tax=Bradyrhizobium sp. HKCCYLR20261 TaxID=3420760 RepID=UPI003EB77F32